ncbi:MAG: hypothetical protein MUP58_00890, partial [Candidatus Nanohaloarchaeota archaeon QJJ-9]|nr:hypothetical protein [Candidatus Nanohaloarchaeota archaeon QJJ-9]
MKETNLGIPILLAISIAGIFALPIADTPTSGKEESLNYHSQVNIYKNGDLVESTHNLLTDDGKDWLTNTQLDPDGGSDPGLEFMVLGNGSIPEADDTSHPSKITSCGLSGADITWGSAGT